MSTVFINLIQYLKRLVECHHISEIQKERMQEASCLYAFYRYLISKAGLNNHFILFYFIFGSALF